MKNKNIVITGASQGLGYDLAKNFSKNGAKLFLISSDERKLIKIKNNCYAKSRHMIFPHDLSNPSMVSIVASKIKSFFNGKIDAIIHVAGGGLGMKEIDLNHSDLLKVLNLNILSSIELNRQIFPLMKKRKKGSIVHIGSIASGEAVGSLSYNIAKSILHTYVRTMGNELAKKNIIVSGLALGGFIAKDNAMERFKNKNLQEYKKFIKLRLPRAVMGKTSEIIPMIQFLCSDNAGMMSGCMVPMDGGEGKYYTTYQ